MTFYIWKKQSATETNKQVRKSTGHKINIQKYFISVYIQAAKIESLNFKNILLTINIINKIHRENMTQMWMAFPRKATREIKILNIWRYILYLCVRRSKICTISTFSNWSIDINLIKSPVGFFFN